MRIVIDLQGAQSASRNRGIGRYSLGLSQGLTRNRGRHEVLLALNGMFPETIETIREAFRDLLPPGSIRVWAAPGPVAFLDPANDGRRDAAEHLREAFLASLKPDIVLVTSLFEGFGDNVVGSVRRQACLPTAVVLYDLIPLIRQQIYLSNPTTRRWYMEKLEHLKRADLLLAISTSSGREAVEWLGFNQEWVVNISTACEPYFSPRPVTRDMRQHLQSAYGIDRQFVMYTSAAIEPRKNIEGLIRAYARLPAPLRSAHQLVIVCAVQASERKWLMRIASGAGLELTELVLTGYVPDDDMVTLYNACKLFVFPSWHEGFGLPVLEAMQCGKAVIAANTSALPEVVGRSDVLFDPHSEADITAKINRVLEDEDLRQALERHGLEHARQFSWNATARRALEAMERLHTDRQRSVVKVFPENNMQQLKKGVNLIGYVRAEMGVGQGCRGNASAMNAEGIPFTIINFEVGNPARMTDLTWKHKETGDAIYNTNLFHVNADQTPVVRKYIDGALWKNRYNIGHWTWELPEFPDEWCSAFNYFNEIWVPSEFVRESVVKKSPLPVVCMPYPIDEPQVSEQFNRLHFGIPEAKFLFLAMYDVHSFQARKNPYAAIQAFIKAFFGDSQVGLVIKVNNGKSNPYEVQQLQMIASKCNNVFILDKVLSRIEINSLINSVDCFISLHRSEGFGLVIAEAMYLGKPVIATNWSGNVDFMSKKNSCPVNYKLTELTESYGPYKKGQYWAEPDIEHAKYYMQKIFKNNSYRCSIGAEAKEYVRTNLSPLTVGKMIYQRLVDIQRL